MAKEKGVQRHKRFTKRLEVTFGTGELTYRGILSNFSESGLFVRTNRGFSPNTVIDIEIVLPDNKLSRLKGIVKRTIKRPVSTVKNGMGIELIEKDEAYLNFLKSYTAQEGNEEKENFVPETSKIVSCKKCGIKNEVLVDKIYKNPRCGKCGTPLVIDTA